MALTKITTSVVAVNSLTAANIADNSIDATKIANNQILARHIAADALSDQIADNSITAGMIPNATALTLDGGVTVDEITIDADTITATDDFIIDATTNIFLDADAGEVVLRDGGTNFGYFHQDSDNFEILSTRSDGDIIIKGNDGGSTITALTLDMSDAGTATFNHDIRLGDNGQVILGAGSDFSMYHDGSNTIMNEAGTGGLRISSSAVRMDLNSDTDYSSTGEPAGILTLYNSNGSDGGGVNNYSSLEFNTGDGATSQGFINYIRTADNQGSFAFSQRTGSSSYAEAMRIDSSGNVGIGATPKTTEAGWTNLSVGGQGALINSTSANAGGRTQLSNNVYVDESGNYSYISTDEASLYKQINGIHSWHYAASGSADAHISMAEAMRIQSDGIVVISSGAETFVPTIKHGGTTGDLSKLRVINRSGQGAGKGGLIELGGVTDDGVSRSDVLGAIAGLKTNATSANREGYLAFSTNDGDSLDENMRILSDGEIVQGAAISDTYAPLVNGITGDALVVGRHSTSGSLGLWRTNTMEFKYYHNGQGYIMTFGSDGVIAGDFNDTSDLNLKENISSISDGTTVIKALRPVKFDWKASGKGNNQHGFIAQEVETVLPNAVTGNDYVENETGLPEDEPEQNGKSMNSNAVLAHAVKAIQEQQTIIDDLKSRIETLEG